MLSDSTSFKKFESIFKDKKNDFYGDLIKSLVKAKGMNLTKVAFDIGMDKKTFENIRSKSSKNRREISFFETMKVLIVLNLDQAASEYVMTECHVAIPDKLPRDKVLRAIIFTQHANQEEMDIRFRCLAVVESNFNNFDFDFLSAIKKIK